MVALTKRDLVDAETLAIAEQEVEEHLDGTVLEGAPVVAVSSVERRGPRRPPRRARRDDRAERRRPTPARTRLFVDRVFTITGAGTVVTGTLTGGCLDVGDEVAIEPGDRRARIRSVQTHRHREARACPVARVAANLVGVERDQAWRAATS